MQPNTSSSPHVRSSYGFAMQQGHQLRTPQNKPFPNPPPSYNHHPHHYEHLANSIRNLQPKLDMVDSPSRKKLAPFEGSPTLLSQNNNESRFKPQFPSNAELRVEDHNDQFLRGSCSNVLKKFDSTGNLGCSLRNTTHFNPIVGRFATGTTNELKKSSEEGGSHFRPPNINKTIQNNQEGALQNSGNFLRPPDKTKMAPEASRTPTKFFGERKMDQSVKIISKTPIKYKNIFDNPSKNSGISKVSTDAGGKTENKTEYAKPADVKSESGKTEGDERKTFKSLNEIVESKQREKLALETSRALRKHSKMINGFEVGAVLGKGKFGQVFLCRQHEAGFLVAIKKVVKSKVIEYKMVQQFCSEIRLHSCLDHPNIVKFYGCFEDKQDIYLVLQYMNGGTLFDYLNEVNYLSVREAVEYLRDIIEALVYMHEKSIAHRDIKPENIVISSEGVAKLCDFGWSAVVQTSRKTYCGTFDYAPPEILERKTYDTSVDIWCIGVLTYELLTGRVPFEGEQRTVVMEKIVNVDKKGIDYPVEIPAEAKEFIEALVQKDPSLRPKSQQLLKFRLFGLFPSKMSKSNVKKV